MAPNRTIFSPADFSSSSEEIFDPLERWGSPSVDSSFGGASDIHETANLAQHLRQPELSSPETSYPSSQLKHFSFFGATDEVPSLFHQPPAEALPITLLEPTPAKKARKKRKKNVEIKQDEPEQTATKKVLSGPKQKIQMLEATIKSLQHKLTQEKEETYFWKSLSHTLPAKPGFGLVYSPGVTKKNKNEEILEARYTTVQEVVSAFFSQQQKTKQDAPDFLTDEAQAAPLSPRVTGLKQS